jgi:hypothetical protein
LQLQGQFSAIADISRAYVQVSNSYIRPAINKMELLAGVKPTDPRWPRLLGDFNQWCYNAIEEIDRLVDNVNKEMRTNLESQITALQQRAIEAAAAEDDDE